MSLATKKYHLTPRGKAALSRASTKYYKANKRRILEKHRERVECFFCGGNYNSQYFQREHFLCCPALT